MERNFKGIWIPKEIWLSEELTLQEKVFLVEIDSLDNEEGCFAGNQYFSDFFGISKVRVSEVINSLVKKGYITSNIIYKEGTKQILKRVLKVSLIGYKRKVEEGIKEKFKDSNTINNTFNNTNNIKDIVDYLNLKTESNYKNTSKDTIKHIQARLKEGYTLDDFKIVIDKKSKQWLKDEKMNSYLRPSTLFSPKFESYLNEKVKGYVNETKEKKYNSVESDDLFAELERRGI